MPLVVTVQERLAKLGQFVALASRAVEELIRRIAVREALGGRIPAQRLAHPAHVANDVHQVTERRGPLADLDVGIARLPGLDALDPVLEVVRRLGRRLGPGLSADRTNSLGIAGHACCG